MVKTMARKAPELGPLAVSRLKEPGFHAVGGVAGLYLQVLPSGGRSWVLRAMIAGRRRDMGLGGFPDVTLAGARDAARKAREKIEDGIDPIEDRRARKSALRAEAAKVVTFEDAAKAWPWQGLPSLPWPALSDINYVMPSRVSDIRKKIGRPAVNATPVTVRIPPDQLAALDAWRKKAAKAGDPVSRPEAVRLILKDVL